MLIDRVKLIAEMARQNISVKELSNRSGVSRVTLSSVRNGKSCKTETALRIASALKLAVSELEKK